MCSTTQSRGTPKGWSAFQKSLQVRAVQHPACQCDAERAHRGEAVAALAYRARLRERCFRRAHGARLWRQCLQITCRLRSKSLNLGKFYSLGVTRAAAAAAVQCGSLRVPGHHNHASRTSIPDRLAGAKERTCSQRMQVQQHVAVTLVGPC